MSTLNVNSLLDKRCIGTIEITNPLESLVIDGLRDKLSISVTLLNSYSDIEIYETLYIYIWRVTRFIAFIFGFVKINISDLFFLSNFNFDSQFMCDSFFSMVRNFGISGLIVTLKGSNFIASQALQGDIVAKGIVLSLSSTFNELMEVKEI